ncbi:MAG: hypothetical protein ACRENT_00225, partial [Thermodesulfobacteriota bacterium]
SWIIKNIFLIVELGTDQGSISNHAPLSERSSLRNGTRKQLSLFTWRVILRKITVVFHAHIRA